MDSVYLAGSEEVGRAASRMQAAAEQMKLAASNIDYALELHHRWMDDWLSRLQTALEAVRTPPAPEEQK